MKLILSLSAAMFLSVSVAPAIEDANPNIETYSPIPGVVGSPVTITYSWGVHGPGTTEHWSFSDGSEITRPLPTETSAGSGSITKTWTAAGDYTVNFQTRTPVGTNGEYVPGNDNIVVAVRVSTTPTPTPTPGPTATPTPTPGPGPTPTPTPGPGGTSTPTPTPPGGGGGGTTITILLNFTPPTNWVGIASTVVGETEVILNLTDVGGGLWAGIVEAQHPKKPGKLTTWVSGLSPWRAFGQTKVNRKKNRSTAANTSEVHDVNGILVAIEIPTRGKVSRALVYGFRSGGPVTARTSWRR